jgi:hypothetical protein
MGGGSDRERQKNVKMAVDIEMERWREGERERGRDGEMERWRAGET